MVYLQVTIEISMSHFNHTFELFLKQILNKIF